MKYIIAVKAIDGSEIFEFKTEEDRQAFIDDIKDSAVEYATSEIDD